MNISYPRSPFPLFFLYNFMFFYLKVLIETVCHVFFQVKSVVLHTLNRARFTVAVESFLKTGRMSASFLLFLPLSLSLSPLYISFLREPRCNIGLARNGIWKD